MKIRTEKPKCIGNDEGEVIQRVKNLNIFGERERDMKHPFKISRYSNYFSNSHNIKEKRRINKTTLTNHRYSTRRAGKF